MTAKDTANIGKPERVPLTELNLHHKNPRRGDVDAIMGSMVANGVYNPLTVNRGTYTGRPNEVLAGNHRLKAMRRLAEEHPDDPRWQTVDVWVVDVDEERATKILLSDNRTSDLGSYDEEELLGLLDTVDYDLDGTGYDYDDLEELSTVGESPGSDDTRRSEEAAATLAERFLVPPLTVIDTRRGDWRERKKAWLDLGIASNEGRDHNLIYNDPVNVFINWYEVKNKACAKNPDITTNEIVEKYADELKPYSTGSGTSVFDPVLCELLYTWFSNPGDRTLDPWAGGSVRGIVGSILGRSYQGHELRPEQCEENRKQQNLIAGIVPLAAGTTPPVWIEGDSAVAMQENQPERFDFVLGCPPYYDLETYSGDEADMSNLSTEDFNDAMTATLKEVDRCLKPDRFAAFVVGSARDRRGDLRDMKSCMVNAAPAGWHLANDAVLLNAVGAAATRAGRIFTGGRSLGRVHQDIMIFVKGDRKTAAKRLRDIEVADVPTEGAQVQED
ncbi:ParB N-terminal domain-containing protein [Corynebacterium sp. MSK004]|uniref:ParB N-terminal domain-containing protein n=1 Tax=Corynebacterium sp. MSK004 TaxID=3050186 RepID=UPI00254CD062|nr:ParB N-terminal domain-containing protein [Corynebacterium sp. MSK004]MDK8898132.1 ParB N-terminal domain-containing protein [Corynebacterium sp. MSK004]